MDTNQYSETTRVYYTNYVRNARAITVLWGVLTICFAIINIVVFIQPHWIGDSPTSPGAGYFGLYEYCLLKNNLQCTGRFDDFTSILSPEFKAASFFIGFSALLTLICILCFLLFFFMSTKVVLYICGWIQFICCLCMFLGCVVYPAGWDHPKVAEVCGTQGKYMLGECMIRWTYILAMIGIFDIIALCILCFVLATRQAKLHADGYPLPEKSEYGNGSMKEKNMDYSNVQPIVTVPNGRDHERYSEYSHKSGHSRRSGPPRRDFAL